MKPEPLDKTIQSKYGENLKRIGGVAIFICIAVVGLFCVASLIFSMAKDLIEGNWVSFGVTVFVGVFVFAVKPLGKLATRWILR